LLKEALLAPAKIADDDVVRMRAEDPDLAGAAREYEALVQKHVRKGDGPPSFDLMTFGVGDDGHTASLFPGRSEVDVADRLVVAVPSHQGLEPRLTVTTPVIEATRHAVVLAIGKAKHEPLERIWLVSGEAKQTPARVIRGVRGGITWIIDRAAGGMG
jgi:6-phosphogluconolactonase